MKKVMRWSFNIFATIANRIKSVRKMCLNFCSQRWFSLTLIFFNNLIPLELWQLQTMFSDGRINWDDFLIYGIFCQCCFIQLQKKNSCLTLKDGMFFKFLVKYNLQYAGIILRGIQKISCWRSYIPLFFSIQNHP